MKRGTDTSKKFAPHSEGEHRIKSSHGNSMHVCVCTCAYVCRYVCMWQHVHTGEGMHTRMRICVMVCTHVCTRARSCVYLMCVHACVPPSLTPLRALRPDQTAFSLCGEHPVFGSIFGGAPPSCSHAHMCVHTHTHTNTHAGLPFLGVPTAPVCNQSSVRVTRTWIHWAGVRGRPGLPGNVGQNQDLLELWVLPGNLRPPEGQGG